MFWSMGTELPIWAISSRFTSSPCGSIKTSPGNIVPRSGFPVSYTHLPARIADDKQRQGQARLRGVLEAYVQAFPHNPKPNFLLLGQTGLGKTFFLGCTARALREKGQRVKYLSAYQLLELFRAQHFGERHTLPALIDVDFLAIDDLGTEPIYRNITIEYLQILLDERLRQHKHTAVTSNCLPAQLTERYGERVTSRLFDAPTTSVYGLTGADLRKTSQ